MQSAVHVGAVHACNSDGSAFGVLVWFSAGCCGVVLDVRDCWCLADTSALEGVLLLGSSLCCLVLHLACYMSQLSRSTATTCEHSCLQDRVLLSVPARRNLFLQGVRA
jgi:hypothetical protein